MTVPGAGQPARLDGRGPAIRTPPLVQEDPNTQGPGAVSLGTMCPGPGDTLNGFRLAAGHQ